MTEGLLVLVQLVMAEMTTSPCVSEYSRPSKEKGTLVFWFSALMWKPLNPTFQCAQNRWNTELSAGIPIKWNLSIKDTLNRGHLSNEGTVCSLNHIELCTNLPLN